MIASLRQRLHTLQQQGRITTAGLGLVATGLLAACGPRTAQPWEMTAATEARATLLADTVAVPGDRILATAPITGTADGERDWRGTVVLTLDGLRWQYAGATGVAGEPRVLPLTEIGPLEVRRDGEESALRIMHLRTGKPIELGSFGPQGAFERLADDLMDLQTLASQGITPTPAILSAMAASTGRVRAVEGVSIDSLKAIAGDVEQPVGRVTADLIRLPEDPRSSLYRTQMVLTTARLRVVSEDRSRVMQIPLRDVGAITVDGTGGFAYAVLDTDYPLVIQPESFDRRPEWHRFMQDLADASILARTTAAAVAAPTVKAAVARPGARPLQAPSGQWASLEEVRLYTGKATLERDKDTDTFISARPGQLTLTSRRAVFEDSDELKRDKGGRWTQIPLIDLDEKTPAESRDDGRELRLKASTDYTWFVRSLQPMGSAQAVAGERTTDKLAAQIAAVRAATLAIWNAPAPAAPVAQAAATPRRDSATSPVTPPARQQR